MEKIVLDTSFLLAVFQLKLDIFSEIARLCDFPYQLYVLDRSLEELEKLIKTSPLPQKKAAIFAQKIIASGKIQVMQTNETRYVDDILADKTECIIATIDGGLKRRIKAKGGRVITVRQKKYLIFM
ncbi:MAG TPA: hypothetical protein VJJ79_03240 [Candidatus Nanoarchaeia archaeon]|nr:hypothetical protein [Candidatus Nanoarchaeia archaeon]